MNSPSPQTVSTRPMTGLGVALGAHIAVARRAYPSAARILVVDDNEVNCKVARRMLERMGFDVVTAADGAEAVALWEHGGLALILMDCQMPVLDGYAATAEIRRREVSERIPIIALTAHVLKEAQDACRDAGMDDYLTKPLERSTLADMLNRYLSRSDAKQIGTTFSYQRHVAQS